MSARGKRAAAGGRARCCARKRARATHLFDARERQLVVLELGRVVGDLVDLLALALPEVAQLRAQRGALWCVFFFVCGDVRSMRAHCKPFARKHTRACSQRATTS